MAVLGKLARGLVGGVVGLLSGGGHKKAEAQPVAPIQATRDDAAADVAAADALRRRRGSGADILTGSAGAEGAPGIKLVAGS